jgi:hypothetical protein
MVGENAHLIERESFPTLMQLRAAQIDGVTLKLVEFRFLPPSFCECGGTDGDRDFEPKRERALRCSLMEVGVRNLRDRDL